MENIQVGEVVDYKVTGARYRHEDRAARIALAQIAPDGAVESGEEKITSIQAALLEAWRMRVRRLAAAGWEFPKLARNWEFVYNCPPVGVVTNQKRRRTCKKTSICPFCWCRQHVRETYLLLEYFYFGGKRKVRLNARRRRREAVPPKPNHLFEFTWESDFAMKDYTIEKLFKTMILPNRRFLVTQVPTEGAFQLITVMPPDTRENFPYWQVSVRLLAIMPTTGFVLPDALPDVTVRHHPMVSRDILEAATGRACSYPVQLFRGPVAETAALANFYDQHGRVAGRRKKTPTGGSEVKGFRMTSTYGSLRCGKAWKKAQALEDL